MLPNIQHYLKDLILRSLTQIAQEKQLDSTLVPLPNLERPKVVEHGDVATNVAMQLAKPWKINPRDLAGILVEKIQKLDVSQYVVSAEIAGPGFINFRLSQAVKQSVVQEVLKQGLNFGIQSDKPSEHVLVEFVSANPTGPLHVGHGRQAVLGDVLSSVLQTQGKQVHREFYYNDAGVQIQNLAISTQARINGLEPGMPDWPTDAYNGQYIQDIAKAYLAGQTISAADLDPVVASKDPENLNNIRSFAVAYLRQEQDIDLKALGVKFDEYFLESSLYANQSVENIVADLSQIGKSYEQDGALWLRTTDDGDDKDRVMKKTDGSYTYFVPDVAYHASKWLRGYHEVINIQGSDHHGTIARVRSGIQGVAINRSWDMPRDYPQYILHKMVTVLKGGEVVKISKRAGSYVTVRDLIEWSGAVQEGMTESQRLAAMQKGKDAVRFFLISRKADTEFVFDIDLALLQSDENPIFYVQYAHARICSILRQWAGVEDRLKEVALDGLVGKAADDLMRRLSEFPQMLTDAAKDLTPHSVAFYLRDLAADFHAFYNSDRVLVDDLNLKNARLALLLATKLVIANGLRILGVSAPEKM